MRPPATIVSLVGILLLSGSFAATWVVDPGGGGDATTIQGGVDLASGGDEVLIQPGTYGEEVAVPVPLTLRGVAGREATVIDAEDVRPFCLHLGANAGGSLVEGLTLTGVNGGYGYCTGVSAMNIACDATLSSCSIAGNVCRQTPISVGGATVTFQGTHFVGNEGMGWQCGQIDPDGGAGCLYVTLGGTVRVDGCVFELNTGNRASIGIMSAATIDIRNSEIRTCGDGPLFSADVIGLVHLEGNLFADNDWQGFLGNPYNPWEAPILAEIVGNTFVRNARLFWYDDVLAPGSFFRANVITGGEVGLHVPDGVDVEVTCNDSWGNGTNWVNVDPASGGNFSLPPKYCDATSDDFTIAENSPLLPANNPCGVQIGAFGNGCGPLSIEPASWGSIKAKYRR